MNITTYFQNLETQEAINQRKEFIGSIWSYALSLESRIVSLRHLANAYAGEMGMTLPFPEPEDGFRERFFDGMKAHDEFSDDVPIPDLPPYDPDKAF
jgi:hypothetical protein